MIKFATLDSLALALILVGALNWGLIGIFDYNAVTALFGDGLITKITYVLVGFAAVYFGFKSVRGGKK